MHSLLNKAVFTVQFNYTNQREHGRFGIERGLPSIITPDGYIVKKYMVTAELANGYHTCVDDDGVAETLEPGGNFMLVKDKDSKSTTMVRTVRAAIQAMMVEIIQLTNTPESAPDYEEKLLRAEWIQHLINEIKRTVNVAYPDFVVGNRMFTKGAPVTLEHTFFMKVIPLDTALRLSIQELQDQFKETGDLRVESLECMSLDGEGSLWIREIEANGKQKLHLGYDFSISEIFPISEACNAFSNYRAYLQNGIHQIAFV